MNEAMWAKLVKDAAEQLDDNGWIRDRLERFDAETVDVCNSPIERAFLMAWRMRAFSNDTPVMAVSHRTLIWDGETTPLSEMEKVLNEDGAYFARLDLITPQKKMLGYIADFAITRVEYLGEGKCPEVVGPVIVECDGKDFHDASVDALRRDRQRDRVFQQAGFAVLRFTGSEIFQAPGECVHAVWQWFTRELCRRLIARSEQKS